MGGLIAGALLNRRATDTGYGHVCGHRDCGGISGSWLRTLVTFRFRMYINYRLRNADVAELVDARVSEARDGNIVEVQVLSSAPFFPGQIPSRG